MKLKDEVGRDGRAKKYVNKICKDSHVQYTSLHLFFDWVQEQITGSIATVKADYPTTK